MYRTLSAKQIRQLGLIQCVQCKRWLNPDDFLHVREVDLTRHHAIPIRRKCVYCIGGIPHVDQRAH